MVCPADFHRLEPWCLDNVSHGGAHVRIGFQHAFEVGARNEWKVLEEGEGDALATAFQVQRVVGVLGRRGLPGEGAELHRHVHDTARPNVHLLRIVLLLRPLLRCNVRGGAAEAAGLTSHLLVFRLEHAAQAKVCCTPVSIIPSKMYNIPMILNCWSVPRQMFSGFKSLFQVSRSGVPHHILSFLPMRNAQGMQVVDALDNLFEATIHLLLPVGPTFDVVEKIRRAVLHDFKELPMIHDHINRLDDIGMVQHGSY